LLDWSEQKLKKTVAKKPTTKLASTNVNEKTIESELETRENDDCCISTSFNKDGTLSATTYWESRLCKEGCPYLVHQLGVYSLLLPEDMDLDDGNALSIYITRGTYQGKKDCLEILFDNKTKNPLRIFLNPSQILVLKFMETGRKGQLYIYSSYAKLDMFYYSFKEVCYRETDTLPSSLPLPAGHLDFGQ